MRWGDRIVSHLLHAGVFAFCVVGLSILVLLSGNAISPMMTILSLYNWCLVMVVAMAALGFALKYIGKQRIKYRLLNARCHVCAHCFYDLTARPSNNNTCPECGLYTPRRECVRLWCKLLRSRI
jgi:hypothetical protein